MNARRAFLMTTALTGSALALAACAAAGASTSVEQVIATTQAILSYASPVVSLISIFAPGAGALVSIFQAGLATAASIFSTISSTMTTAAAQPIVSKVASSLGGALDVADQAVGLITDPKQKAAAQVIVAEARTALAVLNAFAGNVANVISTAALVRVPEALHVRKVQ